jgi:AraC-like DNA-binding protein
MRYGAPGAAATGAVAYDAAALARCCHAVGRGYQVLSSATRARGPLLEGHFRVSELRPGLSVHSTDAHDLHTLQSQVELDAGLSIVVLLAGQIDVSFGHTDLRMVQTQPAAAQGALVSLAEPERFTRRAQRGRYARKVSVGVEAEWLDASGAAAGPAGARAITLLHTHLAQQGWSPSARATAIAEQLIHPPALEPMLLGLYLESRALDLTIEALGSLAPARPPAALRPRDLRRLQDFIDWLDSGEADGLTLAQMAQQAGVNPTTLQQRLRQARGCSVVDYLRKRRLSAARWGLEQQGLTVAQAAERAGYTYAANFATAFKRQFGLPPHRCRASL